MPHEKQLRFLLNVWESSLVPQSEASSPPLLPFQCPELDPGPAYRTESKITSAIVLYVRNSLRITDFSLWFAISCSISAFLEKSRDARA